VDERADTDTDTDTGHRVLPHTADVVVDVRRHERGRPDA
jgi:hypothetical protein